MRRQWLDDVGEPIAKTLHEGQDLRRADALAGRIVRDGTGRHRRLSLFSRGARRIRWERELRRDRVMGDAEAAARVGAAVEHETRAGRIALHQPRLVEEGRAHASAAVVHDRLDERAHAATAHGARSDRAHLHSDRRLLAGAQAGDRARLAAVARKVLEQLADRAEPQRCHTVGELAGGQCQRLEQALRSRPAQRRGEQFGAAQRVLAGERANVGFERCERRRGRAHESRRLDARRGHAAPMMIAAAVVAFSESSTKRRKDAGSVAYRSAARCCRRNGDGAG